MTYGRGIILSLFLFAVLFATYAASPIRTSYDSRWSIHTAASLAEGKGGDLKDYLPLLERHRFYSIKKVGDRYYTIFPVGASLFSMPIIATYVGLKPDFKEAIKESIPDKFEKQVASVYGAIAGLLFFWLVYSRFPSMFIALASTMIFALGTSMWSTATRALWQHGPMVMMLVAAMLLLVRGRHTSAIQYASIPLACAFIIRPTAAIPIAVLSIYVLIYHREWFIRYALWGCAVAIPWFAYNLHEFGVFLTEYYRPTRIGGSWTVREALLGNLLSPSRGLLVYSPIFILSLGGFALALRKRDERPLHLCFAAIVVAHWLVVSRFPHWWAGHSYGPRFMTDVVPFLAYFIAFNFERLGTLAGMSRGAAQASIVLLATLSVVIHSRGATSEAVYQWNKVPNNIDEAPARLWDWRDPQFARGWRWPWGRN
jgi:hypothetical protein